MNNAYHWPDVLWVCSLCAMTVSGLMLRYLPPEVGGRAAVARGVVGGMGLAFYVGVLYWWHVR